MTRAALAGLLAVPALGLLGGCSGDDAPEDIPVPVVEAVTLPVAFDPTIEPAAAVMALVPADATEVRMTDYDRVRAQLGLVELTGRSPRSERQEFWERARSEAPLLTEGLLRPAESELRRTYGLGQDDVAWEAVFSGPDTRGWVIAFRDGVDMSSVGEAVGDGVGVLAEAEVRAEDRLVVSGAADEGEPSWATDPQVTPLVGLPASSTYLSRDCVSGTVPTDLEELAVFSVGFEGLLATARLGPGRADVFDRLRLAQRTPGFAAGYDGGVADPLSGRIGFRMSDPPSAARLAVERRLPFAVCGG